MSLWAWKVSGLSRKRPWYAVHLWTKINDNKMIFEFQKQDGRRRNHNKRSQNSSIWTSVVYLFESNDTFTEVQVKNLKNFSDKLKFKNTSVYAKQVQTTSIEVEFVWNWVRRITSQVHIAFKISKFWIIFWTSTYEIHIYYFHESQKLEWLFNNLNFKLPFDVNFKWNHHKTSCFWDYPSTDKPCICKMS